MESGRPTDDKSHTVSYLEIRLDNHAYAVPVECVREIDQVGDITPLPNSSIYVCGLMNLRGQVLPVIDLKVRLGEAKSPLTRESCVVVIDTPEGPMGMLVDAVSRVVNLPKDTILPTPETCHLKDHTLVAAIAREGNRMITLLDITHCVQGAVETRGQTKAPSTPLPDALLGLQAVKLLG